MNKSNETLKLSSRMRIISAEKCRVCQGTGQDEHHKYPDGAPAACKHCEGYGTEPLAGTMRGQDE